MWSEQYEFSQIRESIGFHIIFYMTINFKHISKGIEVFCFFSDRLFCFLAYLIFMSFSLFAHAEEIELKPLETNQHEYLIADINDSARIYKHDFVRKNCFVVISKNEYRLYVYERLKSDTLLIAHYPICYAVNKEQKTKENDKCTPHSEDEKDAFKISQIINSSSWKINFKDGRGKIPVYGHWFHRLQLTGENAEFHSIGIHGCGVNEPSVPGRDSAGCIRLRNADIESFHDRFAYVGMPVIIRSHETNKYAFEIRAEEILGNNYVKPSPGNPLFLQFSDNSLKISQ